MPNQEIVEMTDPQNALRSKEDAQTAAQAAAKLKEELGKGVKLPPLAKGGFRTFVTAEQTNTKFLVNRGTPITAPFQAASISSTLPVMGRTGAKWVRFVNGIFTSDDPELIAWCLGHSGSDEAHVKYHETVGDRTPRECRVPIGLCREEGPGIDVWVEMKQGQNPRANRDAVISKEIDIDEFMNNYRGHTISHGAGADISEMLANNEAAADSRAKGRE